MKKETRTPGKKNTESTSWGKVASWYDDYLETSEDTFQAKVIAPNLTRILNLSKKDTVLDLACGQGYFTRLWKASGAMVTGADIGKELIEAAKKHSPDIEYHVTPAHNLPFAKSNSYTVVAIVLAIQNIANMQDVFTEAARVLAPGGRFVLVLNHPSFRIPKRSSWQWDAKEHAQYRRIDGYLSSQKIVIDMNPGKESSEKTISYHRSMQEFFKAFRKAGFAVTNLEEWLSHKKSQKGPRQEAEDRIRKEIPMFMMIEAKKL